MDQINQNPPPVPPRSGRMGYVILGVIVLLLLGIIGYLMSQGSAEDNSTTNQQGSQINNEQSPTPQAPQPSPSQSQSPQPSPAPAQTQSPNPTPAPSPTTTTATFAGEWNGTFASSASAVGDCKASGTVRFSINSSGNVTGYVTFGGSSGVGTGKVDANGNFSGSWNHVGLDISYSGKFSGNSGSGTYRDTVGCTGSFSVKR